MPKKVKQGVVVSNKMDKTIIIEEMKQKMHDKYKKRMISTKNYKARDIENVAQEGDVVSIVENRPLSGQIRWVLDKVVEARK